MTIYYICLLIFIYIFLPIGGILSALIIRMFQHFVYSKETLLKIKVERGMKYHLENNQHPSFSKPLIYIHLIIEDFFVGIIRGLIAIISSYIILSTLTEINKGLFFSVSFVAISIYVWRNCSHTISIKEEFLRWIGDFLSLIIFFVILSL